MGHIGTRPYDGFRPYTPQNDDGMRIDPAPSEPWASGPRPAAAAAAAPALEPPVVIAVFQGLRVMPVRGLSPRAFQPNSGLVVLPSMTPPAAWRRRTNGASTSGTRVAKMWEPDIVRTPRVNARSLIEYGTPCSGPRGPPRMTAASASRARASAVSAVSVQNALSVGFTRSMRSRAARVSSTGESCLARIIVTSSVAGVKQRSVAFIGVSLSRASAQARIESVAEPVAEQVQAQPGDGEGQAGEEAHPESLADHVLAAGDHVAPGRHVRRHADAEEAEDGLGQDGVGEDEARLHEHRGQAVRQDVTDGDGGIGAAQRTRRLDVILLAQAQHDGPDEHGRARSVYDGEREDDVGHAGAAHGHQRDGEQDGGEGHEPIHDSHHDHVEPPVVARHQPDGDTAEGGQEIGVTPTSNRNPAACNNKLETVRSNSSVAG